jgi:myosin-5
VRFDSSGALCGGAVRTYLLEKSRAVAVPPGERSFHVFYQLLGARRGSALLAAADLPELPSPVGCRYLAGDGDARAERAPCLHAPGIDDAAHGEELEAALASVGLSARAQLRPISRTLAACLLLGNLTFDAAGDGASAVSTPTRQTLADASGALDLTPSALEEALVHKRLTIRGETSSSPRSPEQAAAARDALAKALFEGLFANLVATINAVLDGGDDGPSAPQGVCASADGGARAAGGLGAVGVLDIFGFESFAINSFEQLCINYANEKLQHQFNAITFEEQRAEFEHEGVPWRGGDFASNSETLALLEGKLSIVALLHEQTRLPRGEDAKFVEAVRTTHANHPSLYAPKLPTDVFAVRHYVRAPATPDGGGSPRLPSLAAALLLLRRRRRPSGAPRPRRRATPPDAT